MDVHLNLAIELVWWIFYRNFPFEFPLQIFHSIVIYGMQIFVTSFDMFERIWTNHNQNCLTVWWNLSDSSLTKQDDQSGQL